MLSGIAANRRMSGLVNSRVSPSQSITKKKTGVRKIPKIGDPEHPAEDGRPQGPTHLGPGPVAVQQGDARPG